MWAVRERFRQLGSVSRFHGWMKEILDRPDPLMAGDPEMRALKLQWRACETRYLVSRR